MFVTLHDHFIDLLVGWDGFVCWRKMNSLSIFSFLFFWRICVTSTVNVTVGALVTAPVDRRPVTKFVTFLAIFFILAWFLHRLAACSCLALGFAQLVWIRFPFPAPVCRFSASRRLCLGAPLQNLLLFAQFFILAWFLAWFGRFFSSCFRFCLVGLN